MQINVSQLLQEPIGATRDYLIDDTAASADSIKDRPVRGECHLLRTQRSILAECTLETEAELTCSRCLCQFRYPITVKFREEYVPTVDVVTGAPVEAPDEPSIFTIDEHHILDLTEAIRQFSLLAIPMKPLCSEDCAGICQNCGKNLNEGSCDCPKDDIDPRWSELTKLLHPSAENS